MKLQRALEAARAFHAKLFDWHMNVLSPTQRQRMLQIAGVGRETLFRLEIQQGWLGLWEQMNKITERTEDGNPNREGDGRVALASAELEKIQIRYVKGDHGSVQNIGAVVKDALAQMRRAVRYPSREMADQRGLRRIR